MDKELLIIIKKQTSIIDDLEIERIYYECKENISETILKLSLIEYSKKDEHKTMFDEMREILDDKARVYQKIINKTT
jgi:hypothetical protein